MLTEGHKFSVYQLPSYCYVLPSLNKIALPLHFLLRYMHIKTMPADNYMTFCDVAEIKVNSVQM